MTQEHRLVGIHAHRQASGTGQHNHRRGIMGDAAIGHIGYSRCDLGTGKLSACPDEPDPVMRLIVKASQPPPVPSPKPRTLALRKGGCALPGHERAARIGGTYCRTCQSGQDRARRGAA